MINCFICSFSFENPRDVCTHIKKLHPEVKAYKCTSVTCRSMFTELWSYRRHLDLCYKPIPISSTENVSINRSELQRKLKHFEKTVDSSALAFVSKLASNMSVPRNHTFEVISEMQTFLTATVVEGFNELIKPYLSKEQQPNAAYFIKICQDPFRSVKSEYKLDSVLKEADLMIPSTTFDINEKRISNKDFKRTKGNGTSHINKDVKLNNDCKYYEGNGTLLPLAFQFKKFFELPDVFKLTQKYSDEVSKDKNISHFINAEVWKEKLKSFQPNEIVIPFHLHIDETQINNALGSHRSIGLETCTYYSFPSIPPQYGSRLENIFVAQLFSTDANKKCGNFACFNALVEALNEISHEPITLNIDGREEKVFFALGLILGDNKGVNDQCGFAKSHSANFFCRFCKLHKNETKTTNAEVNAKLRNKTNYEEDLGNRNFKLTGIVEDSFVNLIFLCHATVSLGIDMMHDVFEGILHYNMCEIILSLIDAGYFSLDTFNKLKNDLSYGEVEAGNKSPPITMKRLEARKLLMSASEMHCFFHHFTLMVGDLVTDKNNEVWQFFLQTTKFVDMLYLPFYTTQDLQNLTHAISKMNEMYRRLFKTTLKPKHHYVTHYPTMIRRFGPLYYISSMRYEAKHKIIKNYTKNTASRVNLSYSLGRKVQYNFACRLLSKIGLVDAIDMGRSKYFNLEHSNFFAQIEKSQQLQGLLNKVLKETSKVIINGIEFSKTLNIIFKRSGIVTLHQIEKIMYVAENVSDIFFLCREHKDVVFNENYQCFEANKPSSDTVFQLVSASEVLNERQCPVSVHAIDNIKGRFRTKQF